MTHDSLLAMASVIQTFAEQHLEVVSVRQEVTWPDFSRVDLHPVMQRNARATLLRAVHHNGQWSVFDLTHFVPGIALELKTAPYRDQVGLVMYGLRRNFHNAAGFLAKLDRQHLARWPGEPRATVARPTRSASRGLTTSQA
jgi:hypothetical protein